MQLTEDQQRVVEIAAGRHLVLAPPGSGKTEMLSQRILRAVRSGVDPKKMLCATFTNRAAFEMRARVEEEGAALGKTDGAEGGEKPELPDVGNLHHFCHRFLCGVGKLPPTRHVLDEMDQRAFVREVVDVLRRELETGESADVRRTHGITILRSIKGVVRDKSGEIHAPRVEYLNGLLEKHFADCAKNDKSPYTDILSAVLIAHQRRIGIPFKLLRPFPPTMFGLDGEGVIRVLEGAYTHLKRTFGSVDFDDLINETYFYLEKTPLPDNRRFDWVQIDEVQDLNTLQWRIVAGLTSANAVSVYFGDVEQAIFSFLGASSRSFRAATKDCMRHFFRTNFRATPLLLEILMRYSLDVLRSDWDFLPAPSDVHRANGVVRAVPGTSEPLMLGIARELIEKRGAANVAILVRTNAEADGYEAGVRGLGYRYAKVSGVDLFAYAPMRDFLSFVSLLIGSAGRTDWVRLVRRFAMGIFSSAQARYFVRAMFAVRFEPDTLMRDKSTIPYLPHPGDRRSLWAWRHRKQLASLRKILSPILRKGEKLITKEAPIRGLFELFAEIALEAPLRYSMRKLWPEQGGPREEDEPEAWESARQHARERIEIFLRYADMMFPRTEPETFAAEWAKLRTLKEADLLVGDERVVISTIHKAKGRQFDAVIVPDVKDVLCRSMGDAGEATRLLYVAMSRSKRHLVLMHVPGEPWFHRLKGCFEPRYDGYYLRKVSMAFAAGSDGAGGKAIWSARQQLSGAADVENGQEADWLARWEQLADCHTGARYDAALVEAALASGNSPLVRMALKVIRHNPDEADRAERYRELLSYAPLITTPSHPADTKDVGKNIHRLPDDCLADCIESCAVCGIMDDATLGIVRMAVLKSAREEVWEAAIGYYAMVESSRPLVKTSLADALYVDDGDVRRLAAEKLAENGEARWLEVIRGNSLDFDRLAEVPAPTHEEGIRQMIAALEKAHELSSSRRLRKIIFCRARKVW